jgi:5-methylcytosine-specific restriction endonuclease McrA
MPIKPENRGRYPSNWKEIRQKILDRAGHHCEKCGARNNTVIARGEGDDEGTFLSDDLYVYDAESGESLGRRRASDYCVGKMVKVVLTIAHLDHTPENCEPENLRAWCQRCHLRYDAEHHAKNARITRRAKLATGDLFA